MLSHVTWAPNIIRGLTRPTATATAYTRYTALQVKRSTRLYYVTLTRLHVDDLITPVTAAAAAAAAAARTPTCSYGHVDNFARRMDLQ